MVVKWKQCAGFSFSLIFLGLSIWHRVQFSVKSMAWKKWCGLQLMDKMYFLDTWQESVASVMLCKNTKCLHMWENKCHVDALPILSLSDFALSLSPYFSVSNSFSSSLSLTHCVPSHARIDYDTRIANANLKRRSGRTPWQHYGTHVLQAILNCKIFRSIVEKSASKSDDAVILLTLFLDKSSYLKTVCLRLHNKKAS